ncbi:MAG: PKD domain-containing protein, partial [Acidobacteriota bacterium]|nr:PKD domain-containing protein [Acidobacteriota bacterium]
AIASGGGDTLILATSFQDAAPFSAYRIAAYHMSGTATSPPDAAFSGTPARGCAPISVEFTDESAGFVESWEWSFGDGTGSSDQHPTKPYSIPGIYTVWMAATGSGSDSVVKENYVTASAPTSAAFSAVPVSGCAPLAVAFTDQSVGYPTSWNWTFGDDTFSTEQHPAKIYQWPGSFSVTLGAVGDCGSSSLTRQTLVQISDMCPDLALALSDIPVTGNTSGDYTRTHAIDGYYQVFYEVLSGGGPNATSELDHRWDFNVAPGPAVTFHAETYRYTSSDGDDFRFEYSTDNANYTPLVTITQTGGNSSTVALPDDLSGTVYVRLVDTDRTNGNQSNDQIMVNYLDIATTVDPPAHPCESIEGLVFSDATLMEWVPAASATNYDIVRGDVATLRANGLVGDASCLGDDESQTSYTDGGVPGPGEAFYYIVRSDAAVLDPGTYDNPPGQSAPDEGRDAEAGTAGGTSCGSMP